MKEAVTKVTDTLTQKDSHEAFQKMLKRYKYIAAGGDYFEGDSSFMCVLSIKMSIQKSLEAYLMILVDSIFIVFGKFYFACITESCISTFWLILTTFQPV